MEIEREDIPYEITRFPRQYCRVCGNCYLKKYYHTKHIKTLKHYKNIEFSSVEYPRYTYINEDILDYTSDKTVKQVITYSEYPYINTFYLYYDTL